MKKNTVPPRKSGQTAYFAREGERTPKYSGNGKKVNTGYNSKQKNHIAPTTYYGGKPKENKKGCFGKVFKIALWSFAVLFVASSAFIWITLGKLDYVTPEQITEQMGVSFDTSIQNYQAMSGGEISIADGKILKSPFVLNILVLGTDERTEEFTGARSDSMMILSINRLTSKWSVISLQRAMAVLIPGRQPDWLTHTFSYGGPELVLATVQNHLKIDIDRYVRINFNSFEKAIDAMGGVEISITDKEAEYLIHRCGGAFGIGPQQFDGEFALHYARMRQTDNDWKRVQRQRNVISAMAHKAKTLNPIKLYSVLSEVLPLVQTNLTRWEMYTLVLQSPLLLLNDMTQATIPAENTFYPIPDGGGKTLNVVDFNANKKILEEMIY